MKTNFKNINNSRGSILVNRSILDWQHYSEPNYLLVFMTLLLVANHKPRMWKGIKVGRGETTISLKSLSEMCGLSQPSVSKVIKGLVETGEIKRIRNKNYYCKTFITHYNDYQSFMHLGQKNLMLTLFTNKHYIVTIYLPLIIIYIGKISKFWTRCSRAASP